MGRSKTLDCVGGGAGGRQLGRGGGGGNVPVLAEKLLEPGRSITSTIRRAAESGGALANGQGGWGFTFGGVVARSCWAIACGAAAGGDRGGRGWRRRQSGLELSLITACFLDWKRRDVSSLRRLGGLGLGLTIVKLATL